MVECARDLFVRVIFSGSMAFIALTAAFWMIKLCFPLRETFNLMCVRPHCTELKLKLFACLWDFKFFGLFGSSLRKL